MDSTTIAVLALLFAVGAALYSSVGHGGASAYIAAMALFSVAPETMKPTALALNLLVAGFGAWRYWRRGLTNGKLVLAFAITAMPAAFIFLNSAAGLAGNAASIGHLPRELPIFLAAVGGGALLGTWLGVERLPRPWLLRTLGLVLTIAGAKLLFT